MYRVYSNKCIKSIPIQRYRYNNVILADDRTPVIRNYVKCFSYYYKLDNIITPRLYRCPEMCIRLRDSVQCQSIRAYSLGRFAKYCNIMLYDIYMSLSVMD